MGLSAQGRAGLSKARSSVRAPVGGMVRDLVLVQDSAWVWEWLQDLVWVRVWKVTST